MTPRPPAGCPLRGLPHTSCNMAILAREGETKGENSLIGNGHEPETLLSLDQRSLLGGQLPLQMLPEVGQHDSHPQL